MVRKCGRRRDDEGIIISVKKKWQLYEIVLILLVCILAFGLLLSTLGFYWDDWPVIFLAKAMGTEGYADFYQYDRPFSAWTYILFVSLLGVTPIKWHIFTFILRFLTTVLFYYVIKSIWPERPNRALYAALLFAIYPTFFQQSIAVAYSQHFITYALFMASLLAMIISVRKPKWFWPLTIFALLAELTHLFTMEYMLGLELVRLPVLWIMFSKKVGGLKKTVQYWGPYLAVLSFFVVWRMFILQLPQDPNSPEFLYQLVEAPLPALIQLAETVVQNLVYVLITAWANVLDITTFDFENRFLLISWGIAVMAFGLIWFSLHKLLQSAPQEEEATEINRVSAIVLGLFAIVAGFLPTWIVGKNLLVGLYSDRLSLPIMFGAALLLAALIEFLVRTLRQQIVVVSLLVALSIGLHLRVTNNYRWDWVKQQRFFAQLQVRAPGLEPNTALVAEGAVSPFMSQYVASAALNTLYGAEDKRVPYWYFEFYRSEFSAENENKIINAGLRDLVFEGSSSRKLLVIYQPEIYACLWVLSPLDVANLQIPEDMRRAAASADELPILTDVQAVWPYEIFGDPNISNWCDVYQQAGLAAQFNDWEEVQLLLEFSQEQGYHPTQGYEYLPFIQAFIERNDWEEAAQLTIQAYKKSFQAQSALCYLWEQYTIEYEGQDDFERYYHQVDIKVECHGK